MRITLRDNPFIPEQEKINLFEEYKRKPEVFTQTELMAIFPA